ncbi:MAG: tetratricopeptide repeat protein [Fibrobacteria bacterium]|nr:tetratricopeptide repeat protein [Fibrobacteria bacterium]
MIRLFYICLMTSWHLSCKEVAVKRSAPELSEVTRYSAVLEWKTEKPVIENVTYSTEGREDQVFEEPAPGTKHRITLTGLLPNKTWVYRRGKESASFQFKTAPAPGTPFRFCILTGSSTNADSILALFPDFVIALARDEKPGNGLEKLKSSLPVFHFPFSFEWGSGGFVSLTAESKLPVALSQHELIFAFQTSSDSLTVVPDSGQYILQIIPHGDELLTETYEDGARVSLSETSLLVEVQGGEIRAGIMGQNDVQELPLLLRQTSLTFKKTCVYCRSLMEAKQYQKSIRGYEQFLKENKEQALQDDALYQIAYIYDHYLFDYKSALEVYGRLLKDFPQSRSAKPARFRLNYILQHADNDFIPLKIFEKARLTSGNDNRPDNIREVEELLEVYPTMTLRGEILMWLGHVFEKSDYQKAVSYLERLASSDNDRELAYKAALKLGDMMYQQKDYVLAEERYRKILKNYPGKQSALTVKIERSMRGRIREFLYMGAVFSLISGFLFVFLLPPVGLRLSGYKVLVSSGILYAIAILVPFVLYYEHLIPLIPLSTALFPSLIAVVYIISLIAKGFSGRPVILRVLISVTASLLLSWSMLYLLLYHFHYLFVFERLLP